MAGSSSPEPGWLVLLFRRLLDVALPAGGESVICGTCGATLSNVARGRLHHLEHHRRLPTAVISIATGDELPLALRVVTGLGTTAQAPADLGLVPLLGDRGLTDHAAAEPCSAAVPAKHRPDRSRQPVDPWFCPVTRREARERTTA